MNDDRPAPSYSAASISSRLRPFLLAYWLRPENAFWMALRSEALGACRVQTPAIDISCGDGVFSFLHAGGGLDPGFDVFGSVAFVQPARDPHADMFDVIDADYAPALVRRPDWCYDAGTDVKASMLHKAAALRFYARLIEHDNNRPLPFADESFQTVYCNSVYWVERIDGFLGELRRVLRGGGRAILHVKLAAMRDCTLDRFRPSLGDRFLDIIGRGRLACWPALADRAIWEARFGQAGLAIVEVTPFATRSHAHLWDVGLRPIAPLLVQMANALAPQTRAAIKRDWVALFEELLTPIARPAFDLGGGGAEPVEMQYVLTRR